ncbi:MAG: sigma-70 family RNA polymerase sigma factor [Firmicutes bacterium]|nr:sigma-70 family RNA polymerase sigma factor [Bacillota bacterium]
MHEKFFNDTIAKYGDTVLRVATSITGNLTEAEDIFSDVFFVLWQSKKDFESEEYLKAWLIRVAINKAKNQKRLASNRYNVELNEAIAASKDKEVISDIDEAMSRLEDVEKAILYLHYFEGYSFVEIAKMMDLPDATVRSKAKRAREAMKEFLSEE